MWRALVDDFSRVPGLQVATCLSERLWPPWQQGTLPQGVECFWTEHSAEWSEVWGNVVAAVDAVLVIAPESGGLLNDLVATAGAKSLNCTPQAIVLCADKLRLAEHCGRHGIPTIPTVAENWETPPRSGEFPCLIKPRDGAGCCLTYAVPNAAAWRRAAWLYANEPALALRQPSIEGRHLSIAALFREGTSLDVFPMGEQQIAIDGRGKLSYDGGTIPADVESQLADRVTSLILDVARTVPGLRGYVGFDILVPRCTPQHPLLVEINPRLTTSYVGYRQLCEQNLAAAMLGLVDGPLTWRPQVVEFDASGAEISSRSTAG